MKILCGRVYKSYQSNPRKTATATFASVSSFYIHILNEFSEFVYITASKDLNYKTCQMNC